MQLKPLPILEGQLLLWEDYMFLREAIKTLSEKSNLYPKRAFPWPENDAIANHRQFRDYLQNTVTSNSNFDEKFVAKDVEDENAENMDAYAIGLFWWVKTSRRVFNITSDLQMLLDATSIDDLTWGEIRLPFLSFLVELANPLVDDEGNVCRYAMVHGLQTDDGRRIMIQTYWDELLKYEPLSIKEKMKIRGLIKQRNWVKLTEVLWKREQKIEKLGAIGSKMMTLPLRDDMLINKSFETTEEEAPWDFALLRIVTGMCMYLKTLPSASHLVSDWTPLPRTPSIRKNSVSNGALLCSIESSFKLTDEEKAVFANPENKPTPTFGEKCCHFRRGTWARPPGSDITAEKTIHRRPTIVRKDRLAPGELPKGAESILFGG